MICQVLRIKRISVWHMAHCFKTFTYWKGNNYGITLKSKTNYIEIDEHYFLKMNFISYWSAHVRHETYKLPNSKEFPTNKCNSFLNDCYSILYFVAPKLSLLHRVSRKFNFILKVTFSKTVFHCYSSEGVRNVHPLAKNILYWNRRSNFFWNWI